MAGRPWSDIIFSLESMNMANLVKTIPCTHAREFLYKISPERKTFGSYENWIYRGVPFSSYKLVPRLLRKPPQPNDVGLPDGGDWFYWQFENNILRQFYKALDENGLPIPGDSPELREIMHQSCLSINSQKTKQWPPEIVMELLALAQHYGLPTRLLDWSRSPFHAAYFAVTDVFKNKKFDYRGKLAVWALNEAALVCFDMLKIVKVPSAANQNLHAQKGVLTLMLTEFPRGDQRFERKPLDKQLEQQLDRQPLPFSPLVYYTLPRAEAPALAEALTKLGINSASIFPGFKGAAESVNERSRIRLLTRAR
jgi:hypothetical protein